MGNKYGDIMDKVKVTDEMRRRIVSNIGNYDFRRGIILSVFAGKRRYAVIAACLAMVLIAAIVMPKLMTQNQEVTDTGSPNTAACSSLDELSQSVGFSVNDIAYLPFKVSKKTYSDNDGTAEISYEGTGEKSAVFRMSKGDEDNSGDYTDYKSTVKVETAGSKVTLKGSGKVFVTGIWSDDTYSYSIVLSDGMKKFEWRKMIESIH